MNVLSPRYHGFCGGVRSALRKADEAIEEARRRSLPCYLYGSIVHNRLVTRSLEARGVRMILSPDGVEPGVLIIRTHGIPDALRALFEERGFLIVDATCPVVLRNMSMLRDAEGKALIIGVRGHSEIEALSGARPDAPVIASVAELDGIAAGEYKAVVQTTFSVPLLSAIEREAARRGIVLNVLNSICDASEKRRESLSSLFNGVDAVVVVGDEESANSRELCALTESAGKKAYLTLDAEGLPDELFSLGAVALTSGASTPDESFDAVRDAIMVGKRF